VQAGVAAGAWSVDHLEHCGQDEIAALQGTDTVPVLLPSCSFFLREPYGPARALIAADLPVCLATDYNPGSSPGSSMAFVLSLASIYLRMLPEEALTAATLNGAFALRLSDRVGSIEVGKQADLVMTKPMPSLARLPYGFSENPVEKTICKGKVV
jgi:imidazolonepropionase